MARTAEAKKHEKSHIKRPENCYLIFQNSVGGRIRTMLGRNRAQWKKEVGALWRRMTIEEREPYLQEAARLAEEHRREFPGYVYSPVRDKEQQGHRKFSISTAKDTSLQEGSSGMQNIVVFPVSPVNEVSSKADPVGSSIYHELKWEPVQTDCLNFTAHRKTSSPIAPRNISSSKADQEKQNFLNHERRTIFSQLKHSSNSEGSVDGTSPKAGPPTKTNPSMPLQYEADDFSPISMQFAQDSPIAEPMNVSANARMSNLGVGDLPLFLDRSPSVCSGSSRWSASIPFNEHESSTMSVPERQPQVSLYSTLGLNLDVPPSIYSDTVGETSRVHQGEDSSLQSDLSVYTASPSNSLSSFWSTPSPAIFSTSLPLDFDSPPNPRRAELSYSAPVLLTGGPSSHGEYNGQFNLPDGFQEKVLSFGGSDVELKSFCRQQAVDMSTPNLFELSSLSNDELAAQFLAEHQRDVLDLSASSNRDLTLSDIFKVGGLNTAFGSHRINNYGGGNEPELRHNSGTSFQ